MCDEAKVGSFEKITMSKNTVDELAHVRTREEGCSGYMTCCCSSDKAGRWKLARVSGHESKGHVDVLKTKPLHDSFVQETWLTL